MSRRRPPSNMPTESPKPARAQRHRPQQSVEQQPNLGMSPEARYNHNLKVLRRRDPSIISIFDQFSHVCVYHHNGQTWEKNGFEGSMFLYESDSYPPYGFYILNRMGMDDYIQRLYPEDVTGIHGTYCMLRSYPDFTSRRISSVLASHDEAPGKFSDAWVVPNLDKLLDGDKGRAHTVGLWMFPTDAREPMIDVMMRWDRLHSYVKQNVPYPEKFRYGPNRPPPPNPHLRTTSPSPPPEPRPSGDNGLDQSFPSGSASELDKLFAKMRTAVAPVPPTSPARSATTTSTSTATMTVASLFAALNGSDAAAPPPTPTSSGIPLLDSIFASAAAPTAAESAAIPIHSPTPTTGTSPQILNHEVITSLLGLPPSRSASAVSTSYSSDADVRSHTTTSSREGDNEYEDGGAPGHAGSDGFSESSTVLETDPDAEGDGQQTTVGSSAGRPLLSMRTPRTNTRSLPPPSLNGGSAGPAAGVGKVNGKGRVHGDVTPRAPIPGLPSAISVNGHRGGPSRAPAPVPPPMAMSDSAATVRPQSQVQPAFAASSELWPGGAAVDDSAEPDEDGLEDGEIVELDFEDTSALSDPDALRRVMQQRRRNPHPVADAESSASASASVPDASPANGQRRDRGKGRKKGKRERAAEMEQRRALEATRLFQMIGADSPGMRERERERLGLESRGSSGSDSRSASASPSPVRAAPALFGELETPTTARPPPGKMQMQAHAIVNGNGDGSSSVSAAVAGGAPATATATAASLQPAKLRAAVVSTVTGYREARSQVLNGPMEKNEFMRELLTLIHTDKTFVDALWQDYTNMTRVD
ncbi:hypothetical protein MVEN_01367600 [Mycena venus]|uniref:Uncharacterized protein n=1 Tax=Mycena venus TaxID=2733690 RepID=A0A8H6XY37_9AGAR|nr:hypothetical protein MVEN_01367600 [Mycena venus]